MRMRTAAGINKNWAEEYRLFLWSEEAHYPERLQIVAGSSVEGEESRWLISDRFRRKSPLKHSSRKERRSERRCRYLTAYPP